MHNHSRMRSSPPNVIATPPAPPVTSILKQHFPGSYNNENVIVTITALDGRSALRPEAKAISDTLQAAVLHWNSTHPGLVNLYRSYYSLLDLGLPLAAARKTVAGVNDTITIIEVAVGPAPTSNKDMQTDFVEFLSGRLQPGQLPPHPGLQLRLTGKPVFWWLTQITTMASLANTDSIILPLAM